MCHSIQKNMVSGVIVCCTCRKSNVRYVLKCVTASFSERKLKDRTGLIANSRTSMDTWTVTA